MEEDPRDCGATSMQAMPGGMENMGKSYTRGDEAKRRGPDMKRKAELFAIAQGIAAQLQSMTQGRERCMVRQMVEMLLDN